LIYRCCKELAGQSMPDGLRAKPDFSRPRPAFSGTSSSSRPSKGPLSGLADGQAPLRILVAGCSFGCEAYSLAGYLAVRFPQVDWTIDAFDISQAAIAVAQRAVYGPKHGLGDPLEREAKPYADRLFERCGDERTIVPGHPATGIRIAWRSAGG
jgi:SAM-dependent methyltransferase